jgi:putative exosortase-associated protein (TIGR04073 family)
MKKFVAALIVVSFILSFAAPVYAGGPKEKLTRGLANVVASPIELPSAMWEEANPLGIKNIVAGLTWGVAVGAFNTVKRAVVGVYEIVTFPIPLPANYDRVIDDPVFFDHSE